MIGIGLQKLPIHSWSMYFHWDVNSKIVQYYRSYQAKNPVDSFLFISLPPAEPGTPSSIYNSLQRINLQLNAWYEVTKIMKQWHFHIIIGILHLQLVLLLNFSPTHTQLLIILLTFHSYGTYNRDIQKKFQTVRIIETLFQQ